MAASSSTDIRLLLLSALDKSPAGEVEDTSVFASSNGVSHVAVVGAMKSLESKSMVLSTQSQREVLQLTAEAEGYAASGTPEYQLWSAVPDAGISGGVHPREFAWNDRLGVDWLWFGCRLSHAEPDLKALVSDAVFKIGKNTCMRLQWLQFDKGSKLYVKKVRGFAVIVPPSRASARGVSTACRMQESSVVDATGEQLRQIRDIGAAAVEPSVVKDLQKRQLVALG